jgi:nucleotide-binding universal stress UspA family protein
MSHDAGLMVQHLIVPVDGSDASWRAVDVAVALARRADATLEIVEVVADDLGAADADRRLAERRSQHDTAGVDTTIAVLVTQGSIAAALGGKLDAHPEATIVMASHGRGRSAALVGSVTEELLQTAYGPVLVVGPHCTTTDFDGPIIVAVDGSTAAESTLPLAAAWGIELRVEPWIVEVADPRVETSGDATESAYPARIAQALARESGHPVRFEVLHGSDVHDEVADFADSLHASLVVASTHGRTGMARFMIGSTAAAIVRHARCPVLLVRPPHLATP